MDRLLGIVYGAGTEKAYYPSVIYDANGFGTGSPLYKMWYSDGLGTVKVVTSSDGLGWGAPATASVPGNDAHHVQVVYDSNCFGASCGSPAIKYKIWYWDIGELYSINAIAYAESSDGINWSSDQAITQDSANKLVTGTSPDWNYGSYGPIDVIYQPGASNSGDPWGYKYVMYYDGTDGGHEVTGLAYSADGKHWTAYSSNPVLDKGSSGDWDGDDAVYGTVYKDANGYHFWYSGGSCNYIPTGCPVHEGIGYASSTNGKNWSKDSGNPIFHITDGVGYRDPGTPPLGEGSANLVVDSTGRQLLSTVTYAGTRLDVIDTLTYSTHRTSGSSPLAVSLQIDMDYDLTDANTNWQGRLVFEPYYTSTVSTGAWQTWDTLAAIGTGTGNWWATGSPVVSGTLVSNVCPIGNPCTWAEVVAAFPNAGLRASVGLLHFKAGGPWTGGFDGNVDVFTIGVNGIDTTYDFEPTDLTGRASFGFVVKYHKGADTPGGNFLFQFQAGDLSLKSSSFDWLVVAGPLASFQGTGAVNGAPGYRFKVDAKDGDLAGGQPDHLKVKIWNPGGGLIYQADEDLAGGSIVVHAK